MRCRGRVERRFADVTPGEERLEFLSCSRRLLTHLGQSSLAQASEERLFLVEAGGELERRGGRSGERVVVHRDDSVARSRSIAIIVLRLRELLILILAPARPIPKKRIRANLLIQPLLVLAPIIAPEPPPPPYLSRIRPVVIDRRAWSFDDYVGDFVEPAVPFFLGLGVRSACPPFFSFFLFRCFVLAHTVAHTSPHLLPSASRS